MFPPPRPPARPPATGRNRLLALRAELADLAFELERQRRLDAADVVMMVHARLEDAAGGQPADAAAGDEGVLP